MTVLKEDILDDKYVFLDRDGVINKDPMGWTEYGYVTCWEDFHILPGVLEAIKKLADAGYRSVIISNQQCVGKGHLSEEGLNSLTGKIKRTIEDAGGKIAGIYCCTHAKEENCSCRKPLPGMFLKARKELGIKSLDGMFFAGDTERDMEAGKKAGLSTILILSGKSSRQDSEKWDHKPDHVCEDLSEAADLILNCGNLSC